MATMETKVVNIRKNKDFIDWRLSVYVFVQLLWHIIVKRYKSVLKSGSPSYSYHYDPTNKLTTFRGPAPGPK